MSHFGITVMQVFIGYSFYYPLFMAYLWMVGAIFYYFRFERPALPVRKAMKRGEPEPPPQLPDYPLVSIVVPCFNEGRDLQDTVKWMLACAYPNFDILLVNDGSTDNTRDIMDSLVAEHPRIRAIHLEKNEGKAVALDTAAAMTSAQYLACIDADALLDPYALHWMMAHLLYGARVGAVTGNPRVRNRSTLLGRLQLGEYSSIVGLIKRAQRTYGRIFTVSGVVTCFRKAALRDVGYWSREMLTEDIDISWKLQLRHWDVRFEPKALCWILSPETLEGLWKQRLRWSTGGIQVLIKNWRITGHWKSRRMWPVLVEYVLSVTWAYTMLVMLILWLLGLLFAMPPGLRVDSFLSGWNGVVVGTTCLLQIGISLALDLRYDSGYMRKFFWMIWYPLAYWMINMATTIVAVPRAISRNSKTRARWISPDRGITPP
ncbi:MAG: poly-beta,6 N-acetyl-D-glucosamine synthase [Betaproteobacteria bacterium]|nr:poly-beta,6 N-acetyl-D-glucosamine synthase [Betaproteobacteria bacterium]